MTKEPPSKSFDAPCPHNDTIHALRTEHDDLHDDLREILKLLRGEGPNDPGLVGRILKLESQSDNLTRTFELIRNTAIGAIVIGFLAFIGGLLVPHLTGK